MTILEVDLMTALHGLLSDIENLRRNSEPITGPLPYEEQALSALIQARLRHAEDIQRQVVTPQQSEGHFDKLLKEKYGKTSNKASDRGSS